MQGIALEHQAGCRESFGNDVRSDTAAHRAAAEEQSIGGPSDLLGDRPVTGLQLLLLVGSLPAGLAVGEVEPERLDPFGREAVCDARHMSMVHRAARAVRPHDRGASRTARRVTRSRDLAVAPREAQRLEAHRSTAWI